MRKVSPEYVALATARGRKYYLEIHIKQSHYKTAGNVVTTENVYGSDKLIALKIVQGQTTGGFEIGGVFSATLTATFTNDVVFAMAQPDDDYVKNYISVYFGFAENPENDTEKQILGDFEVDVLKKNKYSQSVTAYDVIFTLSKQYRELETSRITYPTQASNVLAAAYGNNKIGTIEYINNSLIRSEPIAGQDESGNNVYYTQRDIIGYIAAINGGTAYYDAQDGLQFTFPRTTNYTISASSTLSQEVNQTNFRINGIVMNNTSTSITSDPDYKVGTIEFEAPLEFDNNEEIVSNLNKSALYGFTYDAVTVKKQGTAMFQLGDIVSFEDVDKTVYKMLIMGIVYDFSDGFFSETLYSLAKTATQQQYSGAKPGAVVVSAGQKDMFVFEDFNPDVRVDGSIAFVQGV